MHSLSATAPTSVRRGRGRLGTGARLAFAIVLVVVALFPLYWMFLSSVLPTSDTLSKQPTLWPAPGQLQLNAFAQAISHNGLLRWFLNSSIITVGTTVLSMVISTMAGYSLSRFPTRARWAVGFGLLVSRMLPGTLLIIPLFILFSQIGMSDNLLSVIIANSSAVVPFTAWMIKGFFDSIPVELEQSAMIDGCSHLGAMWRVTIPLALPGFAATAIYSAIVAWSDFVFAKTLLYSPDNWTITVGTVSFIGAYTVNWNGLMAAGVVSVVPLFVVFFFLEPFLVSGMTAGAVKS